MTDNVRVTGIIIAIIFSINFTYDGISEVKLPVVLKTSIIP